MPAGDDFQPARYLTDGHGLYWIVRADSQKLTVLLEDCAHPSMPLIEMPIRALAADGYRIVRPSGQVLESAA